MPRKRREDGPVSNKPLGNKSLNLHIRLTERDAEVLHAACAHVGQSVSSYVRWLINEGAKHTLAGPSKAERLKALEQQFHSLLPPIEPPPVPVPTVQHAVIVPATGAVPPPPVAVTPNPTAQKLANDLAGVLKERPDASQPLFGAPKGLGTTPVVVTVPEAAQTPSAGYQTLDDLIRAAARGESAKGAQALDLPDDMDDWA